jgi:hypothetical protein
VTSSGDQGNSPITLLDNEARQFSTVGDFVAVKASKNHKAQPGFNEQVATGSISIT